MVFTENGVAAEPDTGVARLNLFFHTIRGVDADQLSALLNAAWDESPTDTLKIIFHARDCRGGRGERQVFQDMLAWLCQRSPDSVTANLPLIPVYGRWKDVLRVPGGPTLMAEQLKEDFENLPRAATDRSDASLPSDRADRPQISLCAKWAPTEGHADARMYPTVIPEICRALGWGHDAPRRARAKYRRMLSILRAHLRILERHMCANDWEAIVLDHLPSRALSSGRRPSGVTWARDMVRGSNA